MDELLSMGMCAGLKKLAEHEQAGTLLEYIQKVAPDYVVSGEVQKFTLLDDLNWFNGE